MPYEVFERKSRRIGTPSVAFQTSGRIALNAAATKFFMDAAADTVILLWDSAARRVGIRALYKKDPRAYKLNKAGKGAGSGFSAVTFFEHIGYDHTKELKTFPAEWNNDQQMLEFSMDQAALGDNARPLLASMMSGGGKRQGR